MIALKVLTITFFTVYTILAVDATIAIVKHKQNKIQSDSTQIHNINEYENNQIN